MSDWDGKIEGLRLNMQGLIDVSNQANDAVVAPMARRASARANSAGARSRVEISPRTSVGGWARSRVIDSSPGALRRESRTGALARSINGG